MATINLGEDEKIYNDIAYKALVARFGKEVADEIMGDEDDDDDESFIDEDDSDIM